uniref:hypothetical protein n=1 Tax=Lactobacillus delbrueckii TaxID=1584 RepID=UPI00288B9538
AANDGDIASCMYFGRREMKALVNLSICSSGLAEPTSTEKLHNFVVLEELFNRTRNLGFA